MIDGSISVGGAAGGAERRQVHLEILSGHRQFALAADVIHRVFGDDFPVDILVAIELAGGYVGGAFVDAELVGCAVGIPQRPEPGEHPALHSHLAAVLPQARGLRIGRQLKWHQRDWALERGIGAIHWTFDPLVRRNCHLNLNVLGADAVQYLPNLYGNIGDALNGNQRTDRLLVSWELASERVAAIAAGKPSAVPEFPGARVLLTSDDAGEPVSPSVEHAEVVPTGAFLIGTPADVEQLVAERPDTAERWREAQSRTLKPLVDQGYGVIGVTPDGFLIVTRGRKAAGAGAVDVG